MGWCGWEGRQAECWSDSFNDYDTQDIDLTTVLSCASAVHKASVLASRSIAF